MKKVALVNKRNSTNRKIQKLKKVQKELIHTKKNNQNIFKAKPIKSLVR